MGGGLDNLLTNKMLTPNISLRSCLAKQLRDVCDAGVSHHWLLLFLKTNKRVVCEHTAKQTTEFGLGVAGTYMPYQPSISYEACLNTENIR
jgi:hypothetical protein